MNASTHATQFVGNKQVGGWHSAWDKREQRLSVYIQYCPRKVIFWRIKWLPSPRWLATRFNRRQILTFIILFTWSLINLVTSPTLSRSQSGTVSGKNLVGVDSANAGIYRSHYADSLLSEQEIRRYVTTPDVSRSSRFKLLMARNISQNVHSSISAAPALSIFSAPRPYTGGEHDNQLRALMSWLRLSPPVRVILLGNDITFHALARKYPERITVEPNIDSNFRGIPLFHSMIARAQAASTELSILINSDVILLSDVMTAVGKVGSNFKNFLLTAARWDVPRHFPFDFEFSENNADLSHDGLEMQIKELVNKVGRLHTYGGIDFWLWNNSPVPLYQNVMPPFLFGRGKYDNWLLHEAISSGFREVVDASEAITCIHVGHSYSHLTGGNWGDDEAEYDNFWSSRKKTRWELYVNNYMSITHGTYSNQKGTAMHAPWRLAVCHESKAMNRCLLKRLRPSNCSCEYSPYVRSTLTDPKLYDGNTWTCGSYAEDVRQDYQINPVVSPGSPVGLPHTMMQLLPVVAREADGHRVITLVATTFSYADLLMNFVCRLKALGLAGNLVVVALDKDLYQFAYLQGLAVYYERADLSTVDTGHCDYGSDCYSLITKAKSRAVLHVLQAGFSVLWSDVDVVWYKDPLLHLISFGSGTLPVQSNEASAELPGTGIRCINSGFYFAYADKQTVEAFEAITAHASRSNATEQPSFYAVLCGENGELVVNNSSKEECVWSNGLRTIFLDRSLYPNGAVYDLWLNDDATAACKAKGCFVLHNNWIKGKDAKIHRFKKHGLWQYNSEVQMCMHSWHGSVHAFQQAQL